LFCGQNGVTSFYHQSSPLAAYHWSNCDSTSNHAPLCLSCQQVRNPVTTNFLVLMNLYHLLHDILSSFRLRYDFPHITLWFSMMIYLLSAHCIFGGSSWPTAVRQISDVSFAIF
jgi:hypothetical protein